MKKILLAILLLLPLAMMAQTDPVLSIDGVNTTFKSGLSLPYWLKGGQTVGLVTGVKSASILEFTEDNGNLKYSQTIALTTIQTVPTGKVWKIEGLGLGNNGPAIGGFSNSTLPSIFTSPKTFDQPGTYIWKVPPGVYSICIEVWGGGASGNYYGGGSGGGYGYQCFTVNPGTDYLVTVGNGGSGNGNPNLNSSAGTNGGTSSFSNFISATGGTICTSTSSGIGGSSTATYNISGGVGPFWSNTSNATGGNGANGANGGSGLNTSGSTPSGGGAPCPFSFNGASAGGNGRVVIYW